MQHAETCAIPHSPCDCGTMDQVQRVIDAVLLAQKLAEAGPGGDCMEHAKMALAEAKQYLLEARRVAAGC